MWRVNKRLKRNKIEEKKKEQQWTPPNEGQKLEEGKQIEGKTERKSEEQKN